MTDGVPVRYSKGPMDVTLWELAAVASSRNVEGPLDAAVWIAAGSLVVSVVSVGLAGLGTWLAVHGRGNVPTGGQVRSPLVAR